MRFFKRSNIIMTEEAKQIYDDKLCIMREICGTTNWTYNMRRIMQEVSPGLFLGPYSAAQKSQLDVLKQHGITHIVCVRQDIEGHFIKPNFPNEFQYLTLNIADRETENIIHHFPVVKRFIEGSLACGGKVLIHGNLGMSRSAALVIAYIMEKYELLFKDAFTLVLQNRFCISPNDGFMAQLSEFEPIYMAKHTIQHGEPSAGSCSYKRPLDK